MLEVHVPACAIASIVFQGSRHTGVPSSLSRLVRLGHSSHQTYARRGRGPVDWMNVLAVRMSG
jgi:hypothetical protein